jgi:hypothetical protein
MKKISKKIILTGGLAIFMIVIVGLFSFQNNSTKDARVVESLEKNVLPYVQENKISFYFDMDWCKALEHDSRSVVEVSETNGGSPCLTNAIAFSDADRSIFNGLKDKLNLVSIEKFREIDTEHPISYRPEHAVLPHESIGVSFHMDCSFCRTRYVYWPHYTQLPPNIEGEITYKPINANWYRIDQDWN